MDILFFIGFMFVSYLVGTVLVEKRHYKSIFEREKKYESLSTCSFGKDEQKGEVLGVVTGSVVISIDPFKKFVAGLANIFGGNISTYETLLDRARRESVLRVKENAEKLGANILLNMRTETSSIDNNSKGKIGAVEILSFATAIKGS